MANTKLFFVGLRSCSNPFNYIQGVSTLFQVLEIQKGKQIILIYHDIF